ncbi:vanillate O-demethylase oxidoreductase VanB [Mycobacterium paraense]|uniref:Vanillate O-demethylase oxidoreductase VanB n=1 Tax=Mycobacterium paraense TaxID=767916 RepID=A0ABX3VUK7_9MYCO|nr:SRPBCC family protein [Mycobacterium paraense]ORW33993.1 vanillate O-demethylase oxidoreductase VanB [Mycobacterium paraense]ORW37273.1 vanillate O-demethylase oxidoreductase VanB [Mycobacterium paraense]
MSADRIQKQVVLRAPLDRVWRAIADAEHFGEWFGVRFDGPFVAGQSVTATITPTTVDEEVAKRQEPHAGVTTTWEIVAIEPQRRFAYRWQPCAGDPDVDGGPATLVEFSLAETPDGVLLTITESGFDAFPEARRSSAFEANSEGWAVQTDLVRRYLESTRV